VFYYYSSFYLFTNCFIIIIIFDRRNWNTLGLEDLKTKRGGQVIRKLVVSRTSIICFASSGK
jgi:hypothetical protein